MKNLPTSLCSIIIGAPTEEWGGSPYPGIMFCQISTQEVLQTEPINNKIKRVDVRITHVDDTIMAAALEARVNEKRYRQPVDMQLIH